MGLIPDIRFDRIKQWLKRPPRLHCCGDPQTRGRFVHHDLAAHRGYIRRRNEQSGGWNIIMGRET